MVINPKPVSESLPMRAGAREQLGKPQPYGPAGQG